jgi:hypothetical protein
LSSSKSFPLDYEWLLRQTVILTPGKDDSDEKKEKLALIDDLLADFDPFIEYSQRRQKGLSMEKPDDFPKTASRSKVASKVLAGIEV